MAFLRKPDRSKGALRDLPSPPPAPAPAKTSMSDVASAVNIASQVLPVVTKMGFGIGNAIRRQFADTPDESLKRQAAARLSGIALPPTAPMFQEVDVPTPSPPQAPIQREAPSPAGAPAAPAPVPAAPAPAPVPVPAAPQAAPAQAAPPDAPSLQSALRNEIENLPMDQQRVVMEGVEKLSMWRWEQEHLESFAQERGFGGDVGKRLASLSHDMAVASGRITSEPDKEQILREIEQPSFGQPRSVPPDAPASPQTALSADVDALRALDIQAARKPTQAEMLGTIEEARGQDFPPLDVADIPEEFPPLDVSDLPTESEDFPPLDVSDLPTESEDFPPLDVSELPEEFPPLDVEGFTTERQGQVNQLIRERIMPALEGGASGVDIISELIGNGASPDEARSVVQTAVRTLGEKRLPRGAEVPGVTRELSAEEVKAGGKGAGLVTLPDPSRPARPGEAGPVSYRAAAGLAIKATTPELKSQAMDMAIAAAEPENFWDLMFDSHHRRAALAIAEMFPAKKMKTQAQIDSEIAARERRADQADLRLGLQEAAEERKQAAEPSKMEARKAATAGRRQSTRLKEEKHPFEVAALKLKVEQWHKRLKNEKFLGRAGRQSVINRHIDSFNEGILAQLKAKRKEVTKYLQALAADPIKPVSEAAMVKQQEQIRQQDIARALLPAAEDLIAELERQQLLMQQWHNRLLLADAKGDKELWEQVMGEGPGGQGDKGVVLEALGP